MTQSLKIKDIKGFCSKVEEITKEGCFSIDDANKIILFKCKKGSDSTIDSEDDYTNLIYDNGMRLDDIIHLLGDRPDEYKAFIRFSTNYSCEYYYERPELFGDEFFYDYKDLLKEFNGNIPEEELELMRENSQFINCIETIYKERYPLTDDLNKGYIDAKFGFDLGLILTVENNQLILEKGYIYFEPIGICSLMKTYLRGADDFGLFNEGLDKYLNEFKNFV